MVPAILLQQHRKHVHAYRHAAREPNGAAQHLLTVADDSDGFLDIAKHAVAQLDERLACGRDAHLAADSQEDALVQLILEEQDLPADRGLRYVQFSAGAGE
jgi:hypothetical protein